MEFSEIQRLVKANAERYAKKHGVTFSRGVLLLKLMEETGEFAEALLVCDEQCRSEKKLPPTQAQEQLASELADVFNILLLLADHFEIDLLSVLEKKSLEKGRRYLAEQAQT
ncbi:hypothetical protein HY733_01470 [Candidatus Uhrbacteria bacterium]|nr:hypothetical protein [Candidatus Uhrbacteria bacterium]